MTAVLAAPAVIVAVALIGIEGWRLLYPRSALFSRAFEYSLADAIAAGNVEQAHAYIRAGQDPSQPIVVRHPSLTHDRWVLAPPLLWAVAVGQTPVVKMLLGYGVGPSSPSYPQALCLADLLGHHEIARLLRALAPEARHDRCSAEGTSDALFQGVLEAREAEYR